MMENIAGSNPTQKKKKNPFFAAAAATPFSALATKISKGSFFSFSFALRLCSVGSLCE